MFDAFFTYGFKVQAPYPPPPPPLDSLQHAQMLEKKLDQEIAKIDNMGEEDFAELRRKRLEALKKKQEMMSTWRQQGHGVYQEIPDQPAWFHESKTNER